MSLWHRLLSTTLLATALSAAEAEGLATPVSPFTPTDAATQTTSDPLTGTFGSPQAAAAACPTGCIMTYCPSPYLRCCNTTTRLPCP